MSCKGHDTTQKDTKKISKKNNFFSSKIVQNFFPNNFKKFQRKIFFFQNLFSEKLKNKYIIQFCVFLCRVVSYGVVSCCMVLCHVMLIGQSSNK